MIRSGGGAQALIAALIALAGIEKVHGPLKPAKRKFTDARKAAAQAKRDRKNAKRSTHHG